MNEDTWSQLLLAASSRSKKLRLDQVLSTVVRPCYSVWADRVEEAIFLAGRGLSRKRNYVNPSEDNLTTALLAYLDGLGFSADMKVVNGNCDIVVDEEGYLWVGEAKLDKGVSWIWKGYQQLTTRYAPGLAEGDRGGMIIYCVNESVPVTMAGWKAALAAQLKTVGDFESWPMSNCAFRSYTAAPATGRTLNVLHQAFALLHDPKDATAQLSKEASDAAHKAKRAAKNAGQMR